MDKLTSGFMLSIGTSIAFETLFKSREKQYDENLTNEKPMGVDKYNYLLINIKTLYRNILGAIQDKSVSITNIDGLANELKMEMVHIQDILLNEGKGIVEPIFYLGEPKKVDSKYSQICNKRQRNTKLQKEFDKNEHKVYKLLNSLVGGFEIMLTRGQKEIHNKKVLVITHQVSDLLHYIDYNEMVLLESHTGIIKTRDKWGNKYNKIKGVDLGVIPFNELLLYVFGDRNTYRPMSMKIRREILQIARSKRWTPLTTMPKIISNLRSANADILSYI